MNYLEKIDKVLFVLVEEVIPPPTTTTTFLDPFSLLLNKSTLSMLRQVLVCYIS